MNTLIVTPIENNDNLLNTINSHIKLRKLKEVILLCWTIKLLSIPSADKYSKKYLEVREADASKQVGANVREEGNKNCSSLYYSNSNSDTATRKTRIKARARLIERQRLELEAQLRKASEEEELDSLLDSDDYCLDSSLDIDSKDNLEDKEATTAKDLAREQKERLKALLNAKMRDSLSARDTFTLRTRQKCEMPKQKGLILRRQTLISSYNDDYDLLVVRFCIFSNPALENIGILTNKEIVEMQTNTATALANKLAAVNKLVRLQTFTLKILEYVETFALVCGFRKIDRHMFRANNTISGRTIFNEFYNCKSEGTIIAKFYKDL
ncbi:hypothetical protein HBH56_151520 [Parastagonospora nodorum]|nr:hypothetical protein HBH56_151520 [Parastagonospora nodorum]KAH3928258.1 hypothetical protein HBH54_137450 [Parastagonospora nodorum]KAH4142675.1 hypothetical protein HBH45_052780 [Parastagonospora nodorum]KAH4155982.1 hypothetical protein HBH44_129520 [Parastagonospora nodorum]KAH4575754.1 hypothetical protein HBH84_074140 [Parastagonospora nodorum]